jgi:hypothetical protein
MGSSVANTIVQEGFDVDGLAGTGKLLQVIVPVAFIALAAGDTSDVVFQIVAN